ncbi:unnamed protein product [Ectocarpus sp. 12 AP-2014]
MLAILVKLLYTSLVEKEGSTVQLLEGIVNSFIIGRGKQLD